MMKFTYLLIFTVLLSGCTHKTPTEYVVGEHVQHVNDVLDYAYNNIEQTKDVIFLENELKSCRTGLISCEQSYKSEIATCEAKTDYWRLSSAGLFVALAVAIFFIIRRKVF